MRIISGVHRGRKVIAPQKLPVRPTTDRAKESLFNILRNHYTFSQIHVLDLFAGTGNISYEFASRGAPVITAVDEHGGCMHFIAETAEKLEMPIETVKSNVYDYLKHNRQKFDVIFADPPYDFEESRFEDIVNLVFENNGLNTDGMLVIEHSKHTDLSGHKYFSEMRNYGSSAFSFFR
ncbi:MAG TPA: 16S rRNA (guanine(966)-N(2))-methyltransferase RsmD [Leeuwenhoekiella sp.]|nr:16S rRNA (guanine(966)-N(2))-methyltransferase RsmD [Leeuwenhoekiella sp.]